MATLTFHDHMNPDQEVFIDSGSITSVVPFGSGSIINGTIGVHETPEEVETIRESALAMVGHQYPWVSEYESLEGC